MTEFRTEIVKLGPIEKHPNADTLSITNVMGGYPCIIKTGEFKEGDFATYVPVDALVPVKHEHFSFLDDKKHEYARIKARKLRGVFSMGLLVPAIPGAMEGEDVTTQLGIKKYERPGDREYVSNHDKTHKERRSETWHFEKRVWAIAASIALLAGVTIFPLGFCATPVFALLSYLLIKRNRNLSKRPAIPFYDIEGYRKYQDLFEDGEEVWVSEKLHGCVNSNTSIWMADGSRKYITKISIGDEILGISDTGELVTSTVLNKFNNGTTKDWYKIKFSREGIGRGSSFGSITVTPDHRFYNPDTKKYVRADILVVGSPLLVTRSENDLTPLQKSVLIGKMLGDASLKKSTSYSSSVDFGHVDSDRKYLEWTVRGLDGLCTRAVRNWTSGYGSNMFSTGTNFRSEITQLFEDWFVSGKKQIPAWVADCLDPISIAFWYMDDGSLSHWEGQEDRACFATNSFSEDSCKVLIKGLEKYGINATLYESRGFRLRLTADDSEKLFLLIAPYIPPCMQRKLPERYRGHEGWLPTGPKYKLDNVRQQILSIESVTPEDSIKWDLETSTHNYFANAALVHNCQGKYIHTGNRFHVSSRTVFRPKGEKLPQVDGYSPEKDIWWTIAEKYDLENKLKPYPNIVLFGEVYGAVQDLKYGVPASEGVRFAAFDAMHTDTRTYMDAGEFLEFCRKIDVPVVPTLYWGAWSKDLAAMSEGKSVMPKADHVREGIVIKPTTEKRDNRIGRKFLKMAGEGYLTRKSDQ